MLSYVKLIQHTSVSKVPIFKIRLMTMTTDIARVTIMLMELISVMATREKEPN